MVSRVTGAVQIHRDINDEEVHVSGVHQLKRFDSIMRFENILHSKATKDRFYKCDHVVVVVHHERS